MEIQCQGEALGEGQRKEMAKAISGSLVGEQKWWKKKGPDVVSNQTDGTEHHKNDGKMEHMWYLGERAKELGVIYFPTNWGAF